MRFAWLLLGSIACGGSPQVHADPRWLGADAAYSIDLGESHGVVRPKAGLGLRPSTGVAKTGANVRNESHDRVRVEDRFGWDALVVFSGERRRVALARPRRSDSIRTARRLFDRGEADTKRRYVRLHVRRLAARARGQSRRATADWNVRFIDGPKPAFDAIPPWGALSDVYTPPESKSAKPKPFVYAAKAHPEIATGGSDDLAVTYATNSFDFGTLFEPEGAALYWPRFVKVPIAP